MRRGLTLSVLLGVSLVWAGLAVAAAPKGSVAFILDCSASMDKPAPVEPGVNQVSDTGRMTRMEAAQNLLRAMCRDLAADGKYYVGLWLYGHRIVWEAEAKHPELLTQDAYLEATVGFGALNGLLPGDDVELAQPIRRFTSLDYEPFLARLDVVKPWGEKPLYLAITRALDALVDQPATAPKSIIVLTDGGNEQWLARHKTSHAQAVDAVKQNITPIHFLFFDEESSGRNPAEQELRDLAEEGGGSLMHVTDKSQVSVVQILNNSRKIERVAPDSASDDGDVRRQIAQAKTALGAPAERTISGSVVYHGKPVPSATITIEGTGIPSVKTDRQGRFLIRKVPSGREYTVLVKAIAKNNFREKTVSLRVASDGEEQPFLTVELK